MTENMFDMILKLSKKRKVSSNPHPSLLLPLPDTRQPK